MIPAPITELVGRTLELERIIEQLSERQRLLTITGGAGLGKTRLAIEVARAWRARWPDEPATFVRLEDCRSRDDFDRATAGALRCAARRQAIDEALRATPRLLVIDSPEPVIDLVTDAVARWIDASSELTVLCASRERLGLIGEQVSELDALSQDEAVAMLDDRVQRLRAIREDERGWLGVIVERVERVPLLIEFAAARMRTMSAAELASRIERAMLELTAPSRALPARQSTIEACIRWSYDMLSPEAQRALACCSVLRGSFATATAEAVIGGPDAIDALQQLRDASLVRVASDAPSTELRLSLFAVVARFAEARAREHALLEGAQRRLISHMAERDPRAWLRWIANLSFLEGADRLNRDAVAQYAIALPLDDQGGADAAFDALSARITEPLECPSLEACAQAVQTAQTLCERVARAERTPERTALIEATQFAIADALLVLGRQEECEAILDRIERDAGERDPRWAAFIATLRARIAFYRDDPALTRQQLERALARFTAIGDQRRCASLEAALSQYRISDERWEHYNARAESYAIANRDEAMLTKVLTRRVITQFELGALARAEATADAIEALGPHPERWLAIGARAGIAHERGDYALALREYSRALEMAAGDSARDLSMLRAYRAAAHACLGEHALALPVLQRESATLERMGDLFYSRLFRGWMSASLAATGRAREAAALFAEDDFDAWPSTLQGGWTCLFLLRAWVDVAVANEGASAQTSAAATRAAHERVERWAPAASTEAQRAQLEREASISADARIIRAWLRRVIAGRAAVEHPAPALVLARNGAWFDAPGAQRCSLAHKSTARAILATLAEHAADAPGQPVSSRRLIEAAWPGERMFAQSAKNRLQVAISALRKAGLSDWIVLRDHGYLLDPTRVVRIADA